MCIRDRTIGLHRQKLDSHSYIFADNMETSICIALYHELSSSGSSCCQFGAVGFEERLISTTTYNNGSKSYKVIDFCINLNLRAFKFKSRMRLSISD